MDPELWGPPIWSLLFSISFRAKAEDISDISEILKLLEKLVPCPSCRAHYVVNKKKVGPTITTHKFDKYKKMVVEHEK